MLLLTVAMELKCSRYVFSYTSSPELVKNYILRSIDLAEKTYGQDRRFARLNLFLDQARFLGWPLPRFGRDLPPEINDLPELAINHIIENQAKILVDVAPSTKVMLENGKYCPVRMICGITPAGDLVWKTHLLTDKEGCPYIERKSKKYPVKTKGTRIVCQNESLKYDEQYLYDCFNGDWPVPFLPEFFLDHSLAHFFSPEEGVLEVVYIHEEDPVHVIATEIVPWYRPLDINRTKALPMDDDFYDSMEENYEESLPSELGDLVKGWDDIEDNEKFEIEDLEDLKHDIEDNHGGIEETEEEEEATLPQIVNLIVSLTPKEHSELTKVEKELNDSGITSKQQAEELLQKEESKEKAQKWLDNGMTRLNIISNCSEKIGALITLLQQNQGQQILVIQPRSKWVKVLHETLTKRGIPSEILQKDNEAQIDRFYNGAMDILITDHVNEELIADNLIVISVSAFNAITWTQWLNPSHLVYNIVVKELEYSDYNLIPENPDLIVEFEDYKGPKLDLLGYGKEVVNSVEEAKPKPNPKPKTAKPKVPKYKVKFGNNRPKNIANYEKALEFAKKKENEGITCEIYDPSGEVVYISRIGELDK